MPHTLGPGTHMRLGTSSLFSVSIPWGRKCLVLYCGKAVDCNIPIKCTMNGKERNSVGVAYFITLTVSSLERLT